MAKSSVEETKTYWTIHLIKLLYGVENVEQLHLTSKVPLSATADEGLPNNKRWKTKALKRKQIEREKEIV